MSAQSSIQVEIVTPRNVAFEGAAQAVTLPGMIGPFQVLVNHAPIISGLEEGAIKIIDADGYEHYYATGTGFAEVKGNKISIVVETAEAAEHINIDAARAELAAANSRLEEITDLRQRSEEKAIAARALNRIKVAEKAV